MTLINTHLYRFIGNAQFILQFQKGRMVLYCSLGTTTIKDLKASI